MPEGPEIRRAADELSGAIAGRRARAVTFRFRRLRRFEQALRGARVLAVESRGKALLLHFSRGLSIYTHNQLYGRWSIVAPGVRPETKRELRLAIDTAAASALLYSASDIEVLPSAKLAGHPYLRRLGTELLSPETCLADVRARLEEPSFQRRNLGTLLLDQGFLAGVGNYLRSEILFVARLHPALRLADLDDAGRDRLAAAALELTRRSYRTGGVTNDLARAEGLRRQGVSFGRYRHHVFDRAGEGCYACGTRLLREQSAGRGLFRCPACQADARH